MIERGLEIASIREKASASAVSADIFKIQKKKCALKFFKKYFIHGHFNWFYSYEFFQLFSVQNANRTDSDGETKCTNR